MSINNQIIMDDTIFPEKKKRKSLRRIEKRPTAVGVITVINMKWLYIYIYVYILAQAGIEPVTSSEAHLYC